MKKISRLSRVAALLRGEVILPYDKMVFSRMSATPKRAMNLMRAQIEARMGVVRPRSYPMALQLEPTIHCGLDCPYCSRIKATEGMTLGHMDWDNYSRLMSEIGPSLAGIAFWQWGEPLLHPHIVDMVGLAHEYGIISFISTNAQHESGTVDIPGLVRSGLDMLIISMDGATQGVYESFRAGGSLDKLKAFTQDVVSEKAAAGRGPLINIRVVATRENEAEIEEVRQFALESGADAFTVKSVSLYYDEDPTNPHLPEDNQYRSFQYQGSDESEEYLRMPNLCRKPWLWPTLRHDGTLLFCECDHEMIAPLGNVFETGSFREVWRSPEAVKLRKLYSPDGIIDLDFCRRCRYKLDDAIRRVDRLGEDSTGYTG